MNSVLSQTGIDVAKDELVVSIDQGKPLRFKNDEAGCKGLLSRLPKGGLVHLEASGGYERLVARVLREGGIETIVHNPLKARRIAQALGTRAKTDPVDAKLLSGSGSLLPKGSVKSAARQALADHSRAIEVLKEQNADLKKRLKMPELDAQARKLYADCICDAEERVKAAEAAFEKRVKASESAADHRLVQSVPCLGKGAARVIVCELPEDYKSRAAGQIASYAGLAPIDDSSGQRTSAHVGYGNRRLKKALYMPALCALTTQPWAKELYARLRAKGKSHRTAVVAIMRRLLVRAVAVLKQGSSWKEKPQKA